MKMCIVLGTRPEIIKLSSIIRLCEKEKKDYFIIHTNQHYSENLDKIFFDELELPKPKYNLNIGSGRHGEQTGKMIMQIESVLIKEKPDVVIVQGDTNTVLAGAIAAVKLNIKIAHVEAGLRSYDKSMPEEHNRVITDHISDFLFAPTKNQEKILLKEGIAKENIFVTGNTIVDSTLQNIDISMKKNYLKDYKLSDGEFFLATVHRAENTDNKEKLRNILLAFEKIHKKYNKPIFYPIHPRTRKMIGEYKLSVPSGVILHEPIGYLEFMQLMKKTNIIITDSGGVQEEACIIGIPCITLRDNTERPETVEVGANIIAGTEPDKIMEYTDKMIKISETGKKWKQPLGDGKSGKRIIDILEQ